MRSRRPRRSASAGRAAARRATSSQTSGLLVLGVGVGDVHVDVDAERLAYDVAREAARVQQPGRALARGAVSTDAGWKASRKKGSRTLEVARSAGSRRLLDQVARDAAPRQGQRDTPAAEV